MATTTNTANTTVTDRTASGNQPDNTPATGTTTGGSGGSGVSSVSSGSTNVTVTSTGGGGTGAVSISVSGGSSTNTVLNGTTAPASGTGNVGDFYINTTNETIYGPKNSSGTPWGSPTSLIGPTGATGANGTNGTNGTNGATWYTGTGSPSGVVSGNAGDLYLDTTTQNVWKCVSGTNWGSVPIANIKGATGATGATGSTGAAGTPGSVWYSGAGTPSSGTGINGDYYLNTSNGDVFLKVSGSWGTRIENLTGPAGTGSGTVTSVSVTSANGFAGTVATASTTPAISLNTTVTGILKSTGTTGTPAGISAAANTDVNALFPSTPINQVYASPSSSTAGTPTFRSLVSADLPTVPYTKGGTGLTTAPTNGQLAIGNGTGYTLNTITGAGTVSVTNGSGTITITGSGSSLPSGAAQGQVLLEGASTAGWYNQSYNVTAFASLAAAITAAGSTGVLYFPTAYTIPSGTTISNPIIVEGLLTCSGAATFNGTIQAPLQKIFTGGTVAIGQATPYIYPEWFGALKDGTSDDQPAIVAALAAVTYDSNNSAPIQSIVLTGGYYIGSNISVAHGQVFKVNGNSDFYAYGSAITTATDCLTFTGGTNITDVPSINGFVKGAGIVLYAVNFINIKCFKITLCLYGVKTYAYGGPTPPAAHSCDTNIVTVNQISDCKYGFFFTDDGLSSVIQGSEYYCNFYTNNNLASPWLVGSISKGIAACMWDSGNVNPSNWNGNLIDIKSIDVNGASNSYGFYSPSNTYFVIEWVINSFLWFGGINSTNSSTAAYIYGYYQSCTMSFDIQIDQSSPWSVFNVKGDNNRIISLAGGAVVSYPSNSNYPGNPLNLSSTSITNSSFLPYPYTNNKMFLIYGGPYAGVTSSIPANGLLTLYAYHPFADGYSNHKVQSVFVRGGGSGYSSPVVSFSGGGGSGASANATLGSGGSIASITMTSGGSSYTSPPTVTVSGGSGSGASLQGILNGGSSNNIQVTVLNSIGLVFESAYDNSANNPNEIVLNFRNVSGSTIASNTQINMVMSVGL